MNIAACCRKLLTYFSPEERAIPESPDYPGRHSAVLEAMNAALQDLFGKSGPWVKNIEKGFVINPPATISIAVTNGSTAATISDWQTWFAGCSIVIEGAAVDNRIVNNSGTVTLKFPYSGTTGTHTATVYHDSVDAGSDVLEIRPPVRYNRDRLDLLSSPFPEERARRIEDFGYRTYPSTASQSVEESAGTPTGFTVETWSPDEDSMPESRLRLFPAPAQSGFVDFPVMLAPPRIDSIQDSSALPIPFAFVESIFLPIAVKKLRSCPFWRGMVGDDDVNGAYQAAIAQLAESSPNKTSGFRFTTRF